MSSLRNFALAVVMVSMILIAGVNCANAENGSRENRDYMNDIISRYRQLLLSRPDSDEKLNRDNQYLDSLGEGGLWGDLDITERTNIRYQAGSHVGRCCDLFKRYTITGDKRYSDAAQKALRAFFETGVPAPNWWHNEIGVPMTATNLLILADGEIADDITAELLKRAGDALDADTNRPGTFTGQNLLWRCRIALLKSCLTGDEKTLELAGKTFSSVIVQNDEEGIQIDGSFHQHGPQLYSFGYGHGFTIDSANLAWILGGTPWELTREKLDVLALHALGGQQWMIRGKFMDHLTMGRNIARRNVSDASNLAPALKMLAKVDKTRSADYKKFAARIESADGVTAEKLDGNKNFWRSDYMAHSRNDYYFSVRMVSSRTRMIESINGENLLGASLSSGCYNLSAGGGDYYNIFPFWDWTKLPGATCDSLAGPELMKYGRNGKCDFVGVLSDGRVGMAAMEFERPIGEMLKFKKSYFCFDNSIVCLGCDISGGSGEVFTGIQQCWLDGDVKLESKKITAGKYQLDGSRSVTHDGFTYFFEPDQRIQLQFGQTEGNWHDIRLSDRDEILTGNVFSLWLSHGELSDGENGQYAYTILNGDADAPRAKMLRNDSNVQAAASDNGKIVQAVFYNADELEIFDGRKLKAHQPCIVMLKKTAKGMEVFLADPMQKLTELTISIDSQNKTVKLPTGNMAGSTVVLNW